MFYRIFRACLGVCLRIFYRGIEAPGLEAVPGEGPLLLVANHGSALMDPLLILVLVPRAISFLAKHTLFAMPVVGFVLRRIGGIPVYRRVDAPSGEPRNDAMFEACCGVLKSGGAVCLFPEGVSHDRPRLEPLRTGAARIFLRATGGSTAPVRIIPVGINFEQKKAFRSRVLILFGRPVETGGLDRPGEAGPGLGAEELTSRIEKALGSLVPGLDSWEELQFVREIERLYLGGRADSLAGEAPVLKRFIEAYHLYRRSNPEAVLEIRRRWEAYRRQLARFSLTDSQVDLAEAPARAARFFFAGAAATLLLLPLAGLGLLFHVVPYRLCGTIERRINRHPDQTATVKLMAGLALFPITYVLLLAIPLARWGPRVVLPLLVFLAVTGWAALLVSENRQRLSESAGALLLAFPRSKALETIRRERRGILDRVGDLIRESSPFGPTDLSGDGGGPER
jgi:glycerol-3-phosphate O-acyltransferase / dihydroxyacetone phosphate acyltransferase